jgi:hypothetical protein
MKYLMFSLLASFGFISQVNSQEPSNEVVQGVSDAYIYGFPLVLMDITKNVLTDSPKATLTHGPINQFVNSRTFPTPTFKDVVSPNADTLYSQAWIDVSKEPVILTVPDMGDRYYLFPLLDAWTNVFFSPGTRTTGNGKGSFAIIGPNWEGTLPSGIKEVKAPTNTIWLIGRIQTNGPSDYAAVNKLQDDFKLTPLSAWNTNYTPPTDVSVTSGVDAKTPPIVQLLLLEGVPFFKRFAELLKTTPIPAEDAEYVKQFSKFGLIPGQDFDPSKLTSAQIETINESVRKTQILIKKEWDDHPFAVNENGWGVILKGVGNYGTNYKLRAAVAYGGLGANLPQDAVYPVTNLDSAGLPLNGNFRYVVHFDKGELPPVNAFWSITMYNNEHFFVPNSINRYAIGSHDQLKFNADGSLDIYIQEASPGSEREANWLPAPKESYNLIFRLYYPKKEVLDGTWKPPFVKKVS